MLFDDFMKKVFKGHEAQMEEDERKKSARGQNNVNNTATPAPAPTQTPAPTPMPARRQQRAPAAPTPAPAPAPAAPAQTSAPTEGWFCNGTFIAGPETTEETIARVAEQLLLADGDVHYSEVIARSVPSGKGRKLRVTEGTILTTLADLKADGFNVEPEEFEDGIHNGWVVAYNKARTCFRVVTTKTYSLLGLDKIRKIVDPGTTVEIAEVVVVLAGRPVKVLLDGKVHRL